MAEKSEDVAFKDAEDEFAYHLIRAEYHTKRALEQCTKPNGIVRSLLCKSLLRRAHGILVGLYTQEALNTRKRKK